MESNNKNICFIANYSKTYLFQQIAEELERTDGIKTVWIVVNNELNSHLSELYDNDSILYLNRDYIDKTAEPLENVNLKINELLYGDRVWRNEMENGKTYLTNIQKPIANFLMQHNVMAVFGEITWAHEILTMRICKQYLPLNCNFLNPHLIRIPNNRFAFFTDEHQSKLYEIDEPNYDYSIFEMKKPSYLKVNDKNIAKSISVRGRLDRIKRFITNENIDPKDPTHPGSLKQRAMGPVSEEWKKETYKSIPREDFHNLKNKPYIFLGVHKQPEASVDVCGRYHEDQMMNILNIWRILPNNWNLIVKEHTNAIGDRGREFYMHLLKHPGIKLVHEKTPSYEIMQHAKLIVTVTGTMGYEAGLMRIPAVTLAPTFFNKLNTCANFNMQELVKTPNILDLIEDLQNTDDNRYDFSNYIRRNTFEGNVLDPQSIPDVLSNKNISMVAAGFSKILNELTLTENIE